MHNIDLRTLKDKLNTQHQGDKNQLEVVYSENPRLIVEAPAGYGKTTTMISRIAYLFASGKIPNPKRILGLTFSVNAALKVKREVSEKLPNLLDSQTSTVSIREKVTITNYHGFCKSLLKKYGYLIEEGLRKDINFFRAVDKKEMNNFPELTSTLFPEEIQKIRAFDTAIESYNTPDLQAVLDYNDIVKKKLIPLDFVTHNSIITLSLEIFKNFEEVLKFYRNYFPLLVIDEFQDTNILAWELLEAIISDQTKLMFFGDPLQRIYGFIGALPDVMETAVKKYGMTKITLSTNYRFSNNLEMLKLDKNIRANAATHFTPMIPEAEKAKLPAFWGTTQKVEAEKIVAKVKELVDQGNEKIAILFSRRGKNAHIVEEELSSNNIEYFYGMFSDDDSDYVDFHNNCLQLFLDHFSKFDNITRKTLTSFSEIVKKAYSSSDKKVISSLLRLLDALIEKVSIDYADLLYQDKFFLLLDIFENRQLKQAMEYIETQVILSTIHGSKGLEWDYVFVCDVEQWVFTFQCRNCPNKSKIRGSVCRLPLRIPQEIIEPLLDDFCLFYVALTRARKQAFISASKERFNANGEQKTDGKFCCFALVDGVKLIDATL